MQSTAKLFQSDGSQAVRLPSEFSFEGDEVSIRKDPATGDVILSSRTSEWDRFFAMRDQLSQKELDEFVVTRDKSPFPDRSIFE